VAAPQQLAGLVDATVMIEALVEVSNAAQGSDPSALAACRDLTSTLMS
jgi:hypothetical protein